MHILHHNRFGAENLFWWELWAHGVLIEYSSEALSRTQKQTGQFHRTGALFIVEAEKSGTDRAPDIEHVMSLPMQCIFGWFQESTIEMVAIAARGRELSSCTIPRATRVQVDDSFASSTADSTAEHYTYDALVSAGDFDRAPWESLYEGSGLITAEDLMEPEGHIQKRLGPEGSQVVLQRPVSSNGAETDHNMEAGYS